MNTTDTAIDLENLEPHSLYRISVVARGVHGSSLPSAMLLINTTNIDYKTKVFGAPSPPHLLTLESHSATWVQISWQPPEFSHPHESISYKYVVCSFFEIGKSNETEIFFFFFICVFIGFTISRHRVINSF